MRVLFVLVILVGVALVIWAIAKAASTRQLNKWKPELIEGPGSLYANLVIVKKGSRQIEIAEIPPGAKVGMLERQAEIEIAMEEAEALAKDLNK